jgi:hypothetical protein
LARRIIRKSKTRRPTIAAARPREDETYKARLACKLILVKAQFGTVTFTEHPQPAQAARLQVSA